MRKINKLIIATLFLAFNVCLVLFPSDVLESARDGLLLWFNRVLPSLLPFAIGTAVLSRLGVLKKLGKYLSPVMVPLFNLPGAAGTALLIGFTSGYPMGASAAAELRKRKLLTPEEAQRLAGFCNNAGPLFVVGLVGASLFNDEALGYKLLAAHIISALLLGIGLGVRAGNKKNCFARAASNENDASPAKQFRGSSRECKERPGGKSFGEILSCSVKEAMTSMTFVGGLIIFFSVLTRLLEVLGIVSGLAGGLLEVTNGVKTLATADWLNYKLQLALTAGVISFGGLSVHAQAVSFLAGENIKAGPYIICKIIHGLLAAAVMMLML